MNTVIDVRPDAIEAAPDQPHVVSVDHVSVAYTSDAAFQALSDVSLKVARGEFISLTGPSGCGKTTLLRLIPDLARGDADRAVDAAISSIAMKHAAQPQALAGLASVLAGIAALAVLGGVPGAALLLAVVCAVGGFFALARLAEADGRAAVALTGRDLGSWLVRARGLWSRKASTFC